MEGHFPRQISLLRPPGAVDLGVSDHNILIQTGIQVKSNVHSRAKVDVEPGRGSSHRPCLTTELWAHPYSSAPGGSGPEPGQNNPGSLHSPKSPGGLSYLLALGRTVPVMRMVLDG